MHSASKQASSDAGERTNTQSIQQNSSDKVNCSSAQ